MPATLIASALSILGQKGARIDQGCVAILDLEVY